ncbi:hypothetical protein MRB53_040014 [Persea americana]|nr:hypothetical protein MRB53_040014 [Persea americana]
MITLNIPVTAKMRILESKEKTLKYAQTILDAGAQHHYCAWSPTRTKREYWRGKNGIGGWRMDAVYRRYLDIIYRHVLRREPPERKTLWISSDPPTFEDEEEEVDDGPRPTKKQKRAAAKNENSKHQRLEDTNLTSMQNHSFHMLRALVGKD